MFVRFIIGSYFFSLVLLRKGDFMEEDKDSLSAVFLIVG